MQFGIEHGLRPEEILDGTGLVPDSLRDSGTDGTARHEFKVIRNVQRRLGRRGGLGFEIGQRYHIAIHGLGALALTTCRHLREALTFTIRYTELGVSFVRVEIHEEPDRVTLVTDGSEVPVDIRDFVVERTMGASVIAGRELLGRDIVPLAMQFRHSAPPDTERYREVLGVAPKFGATRNSLVLERELLDMLLPQSNEFIRQQYEQACADLLAQRRNRIGVAGAVRKVLAARPDRMPDLKEVASELQASVRTLSRRLDEAQEWLTTALAQNPDPGHWGDSVIRGGAALMSMFPVIDEDVVPATPLEAIAMGRGHDVPLLIGTTAEEFRLFTAGTGIDAAVTEAALPFLIGRYGLDSALIDDYRANRPEASAADILAAILTDFVFRDDSMRIAELRAVSGAPTFTYEFAWRSSIPCLGACHALELPFVFDTLAAGQTLTGPRPPQALADRMHSSWVSFAKTGDPGWPPFDPERPSVRIFDVDTETVVSTPRPTELAALRQHRQRL